MRRAARFHLGVGVVALVILPLVSWCDGSGQLAWTMFSRTGQYRLVIDADGMPVNPTEIAAAAQPGPTARALAGADHFLHHDVARATLRRHLADVAQLACRVRPASLITVRLEERVHVDAPIRVSTVEVSCSR